MFSPESDIDPTVPQIREKVGVDFRVKERIPFVKERVANIGGGLCSNDVVVRGHEAGWDTVKLAFRGVGSLPTLAEIEAPRQWLQRVA
jgi:hypothetical protein